MKKSLGYFLLLGVLFFGSITYWPVSASEEITLMIQEYSVVISLVSLLLSLLMIFMFTEGRIISYIVFFTLLYTLHFASDLRLIGCKYIMFKNERLPPSDMKSPLLGVVKRESLDCEVMFDWGLPFNDYETLVFKKDHGLRTDNSGREVRVRLNADWFLIRNINL